ncbi:dipeptidyl aminopeptidase/acylaminoacyl peptidase [Pseudomonas duriflava]|uniref:Dipeptidyl aminopeptidase/acylaminoacyl peptidase n=1 Tax=Pseudomonas duriflava TaxID=459528 RepID=A0A562QEB3_9PSED|nr:prolyl oligopeptidase family serine peptidase [Pseudomonas duriflava]TWI55071.1 dipeptidyl aminopeptidase/acylaminoacyl peptidase [Pseudomonas duriflava]
MNSPAPNTTFTAEQAVAAGIDFAELHASDLGLFWNQYDPADGACRLWRWVDGQAQCLTPDGYSARSRVYEYGGGAFCLTDTEALFVNEADQQLYRQPLDGSTPVALTQGKYRYGDLQAAAGAIMAVEESHEGEAVIHRLVAIGLLDGRRQVLAEGADFYASPTLSPNGKRLAWIEWSRPDQPWTSTRLMCAERLEDGRWDTPSLIASGAEESLQQPRFDELDQLYCLSDKNGWWQPWGESTSGFTKLSSIDADHAAAPFQLGGRTWLTLGGDAYLATWFEDGFGHLGLHHGPHQLQHFASSFTRFRSFSRHGHRLYCIAAAPDRTAAVVSIDLNDGTVQTLAGGLSPLPPASISHPQPLRYPTGAGHAYGFFYPALNSVEPPPLVVFIHGGPTSACYPVFDPRIQYWAQRGFAVADLNYRGSTGYGRAYRQSLHLSWGEADVEDACTVVAHLAERGLINAQQAFIRGGSAGGYTALCALAFHRVFRGGASLYGVTDPAALARVTHKFEADYLDWLIGDPSADAERYRARTPLLHADRINVPVIFFQGELDAVVVPEQTRAMLRALKDRGVPAKGYFYPNERHGFRQAKNQAHALEHEWRFYREILDQNTSIQT